MEEWGYALQPSWGPVRVPLWSKVLMRVARFYRSIYWKYIRFGDYVARRPQRPANDAGS